MVPTPAPSRTATPDVRCTPPTASPGRSPCPCPRGCGARPGATASGWRVAPGVSYTRWDQVDARGPIRAHLLTVKRRPGVRIDYAAMSQVRQTAPVKDILAEDAAIAGVNGDFFDIGATGAPLGLGQDRQRGLVHARDYGWNSAFFINRWGKPDIGTLPMVARVRHHPGADDHRSELPVRQGERDRRVHPGLGHDGRLPPHGRPTPTGPRRPRPRRARRGQPQEAPPGQGRRRPAADRTRARAPNSCRPWRSARRSGSAATSRASPGWPSAATGSWSRTVWSRGSTTRSLHPRTAIGVDSDSGDVLMLVVDGRQDFSRGATMAELARLMVDLGADEALNLDGGGSSTMVAGS